MFPKPYQTFAQAATTPKTTYLLYKSSFCDPCVNERPDHPLTVHSSEESTSIISGRCTSGHKASAFFRTYFVFHFFEETHRKELWCVWPQFSSMVCCVSFELVH